MKSKLDFTKDKLRVIVLELATLDGYQKPSTYLDEILNEIKQFNSFEFECDFFLNIHYLCKENADKFWSDAHRKDITQWLSKARIQTDVFKTTWDSFAKDKRYSLAKFYKNLQQAEKEIMKSQIENNGCFIARLENGTDTVKVYTSELAFIFLAKEITAENLDTKTDTKINSLDYFKTYIQGYKEGEQYFENEFKVQANTLYGANAEQYVMDIHLNYFLVKHEADYEGWGYVKKHYPIFLTHDAVRKIGYYSGIVNKVEEQVKKYPRIFTSFDKCEHRNEPQQNEIEQETVLTDYIEKYLCEYKEAFNSESDYEKAIKVLNSFFNGVGTNIDKQIHIKRGYTKQISFALGEIWRSKKTDVITYEYLMLYKKLFTIFEKQRLEKDHVFSSPLYKYSISKT